MPVDKAIEMFAQKLSEDLQSELQVAMSRKSKTGFDGNTRLGASIRISYLENDGDIFGFELYLNDYYKWVNEGRKAGKGISREGQEKLVKWIKSRGIVPKVKAIKTIKNKQLRKGVKQITTDKLIKKMVFAISKKIKEKGYEATHFFDNVLYDGRIERFRKYLLEQYKIDLQLEINKGLR
jgi:ribosomal protein S26